MTRVITVQRVISRIGQLVAVFWLVMRLEPVISRELYLKGPANTNRLSLSSATEAMQGYSTNFVTQLRVTVRATNITIQPPLALAQIQGNSSETYYNGS